jgi:hypothetical protein
VSARRRPMLPPSNRLLGDPELIGQFALGHPVPATVGADPFSKLVEGSRCVLICIH